MMDQQPSPLPEEMQLLAILCRSSFDQIDEGDVQQRIARVVDWESFLGLTKFHRVGPLVARNAERFAVLLPSSVMGELRGVASRNVVESFRYLQELQRLLARLAGACPGVVVLKGVPLSVQAFGDAAVRDVGDIDLLIDTERARDAERLLIQDGFRRQEPSGKLTARRWESYSRHFKDFTFEAPPERHFEVDLHWRLFRNPWMPGNTLSRWTERLRIGGDLEVAVLSKPAALLYLAVQGALDGWTRMKAVADIVAVWNRLGPSERAGLVPLTEETGVESYLSAALQLAARWIGGLNAYETELVTYIKSGGNPGRRIAADAEVRMLASGCAPELRETGSFEMKRREAGLHSSLRYKGEIVQRILLRPRVWSRFDLPDALFPLYPLLSPVEWVLFHATRRKG